MPSLGELFVELGVVGNTRELEKTLQRMKEGLRVTQKEIALSKLKLKLIKDIENAQSSDEKKRITSLYVKEFKALKQKDAIAGVNAQIAGFKALGKGIAKTITGVTAFVGAIAGAAYVMNRFTNSLVESNQELLNLTRTTDISLQTFQKWGGIGKMLGVENIDQQLEGLNQRLFELMLTGEGAKGFQLGGINPVGQDAVGVLEQLRARISGMNDTTATYLLQQMGLDPRMLHLLRMSRDEFEALGQTIERYQLSSDETRQIQQMNIQLQIAGIRLRYLKDKAVLALMPLWTKLVASFARVAEGLYIIAKYVSDVAKNIGDLINKSTVLQIAVQRLGIALAALAAYFFPVQAALVALYLIIDDVVGYFQGKNSLIGAFINSMIDLFSDLDQKLNSAKTPQIIKDLIYLVENANNLTNAANAIKNIFEGNTGPVSSGMATENSLSTGAFFTRYLGLNGLQNYMFDKLFTSEVIKVLTPRSSISNSTTNNNNNSKIEQHITINSNQPANDILTQLAFAQNAMNAGLA